MDPKEEEFSEEQEDNTSVVEEEKPGFPDRDLRKNLGC
jgi:hypothetical protein